MAISTGTPWHKWVTLGHCMADHCKCTTFRRIIQTWSGELSQKALRWNIFEPMAGNDKHCQLLSTKENGMFGSLGGTLGASPPKCEMQCTGKTSILVQNFNQIRSAVSEEMCPKQTDRHTHTNKKLNIPRHHARELLNGGHTIFKPGSIASTNYYGAHWKL